MLLLRVGMRFALALALVSSSPVTGSAQGRAIGAFQLVLLPGVTDVEFERLMVEEIFPGINVVTRAGAVTGLYLLKQLELAAPAAAAQGENDRCRCYIWAFEWKGVTGGDIAARRIQDAYDSVRGKLDAIAVPVSFDVLVETGSWLEEENYPAGWAVGVHRLVLLPGVEDGQFEDLMLEEVFPAPSDGKSPTRAGGVTGQFLLRGSIGSRADRFLWAIEWNGIASTLDMLRQFESIYEDALERLQPVALRTEVTVWVLAGSRPILGPGW